MHFMWPNQADLLKKDYKKYSNALFKSQFAAHFISHNHHLDPKIGIKYFEIVENRRKLNLLENFKF